MEKDFVRGRQAVPNAHQSRKGRGGHVGPHIENVSYIFDHVVGKTVLGFKDLVLGYFDGTSFTPLDFSIHAEKGLRGKQRKEQYKKPACRDRPEINGEKNALWIKSRHRLR